MKMKRNMLSVAMVAAIGLVTTSAQAVLLVYEPFDYSTANLGGNTGGTGFSGAWQTIRRNPDIRTGSLDWGTLPTQGNNAQSPSLNGPSRSLGTILKDNGLLDDGATLWFSYVMDTLGQNMTNLDFNFALSTDPFGGTTGKDANGDEQYPHRTEIRNDGEAIGVSNFRTRVQGAFWQNDGDTDTYAERTPTDTTLTLNNTDKSRALIVGKIEWGSAGAGETLTLYAPDNTLALGAPILTMTTPVNLDQMQFDTLAIEWKDTPSIDEIRIGSTFEDVIGAATDAAVPEPATVALLSLAACGLGARRRRKA